MKNTYKYIIAALAGLVAVQGICRAADDDKKDNIKLFKTTVPIEDEEDMYLITLDSYVTGTTTVTDVTKPVDLTLVLDVSTSMSASQGAEWLLDNFVKLTTGDNIGILHTTTTGHNNYAQVYSNSQRSGKGGTLRYRINIKDEGTYNLRHFNDGWYYGTGTSSTKSNYTKYTPNAADEILTDVKIDLLQEACRVFIREIEQSAKGTDGVAGTDDDIDHRIGFATFCGSLTQWTYITPVFTEDGKANSVGVYNDGANDKSANYSRTMEQFVNELHEHMGGSTCPENAFNQAKVEYDNLYKTLSKEGRSQVTVMFTDGKPQDGGTTLNKIITSTKALKDIGASVFTVGIFSFNDKTEKLNGDGVNDDRYTVEQYMEYVSSYYPKATARNNIGERNNDGVMYYQRSDGSDLSAIFQSIAQSAGADTYQLSASDAAAIDVMSTDFELPSDMEVDDVTTSMWVCYGPSNGRNSGDYDKDGKITSDASKVVEKVRGNYVFRAYKIETTDTDKIYDADAPAVELDKTTDNQRVIVTGFDYSRDDDLAKDSDGNVLKDKNGKPYIKTGGYYGNWVGAHADGAYAGKMLEFSFKVHLKSSSMGGYSLPTNKATSGIYKNSGTESEPVYVPITYYTIPVVDVPSIIILKYGLKFGDSAIFSVDGPSSTDSETGETIAGPHYDVILTKDTDDSNPCFIVIKDIPAGEYTVTEKTDWTWAYDVTEGWATKQKRDLHAPKTAYGQTVESFKQHFRDVQDGSDYGKTNVEGWDDEQNRYYVMSDAIHLMFKFVNSPKDINTLPLHDEAATVNVYGEKGGTAEYGGVDPEETDWE